MRIAHLCLSNFYIDGYSYQENELARQHVATGHDVLVLASTETISDEGRIIYTEPSEYVGHDGARVRRIPYRRWLPHKIMRKLRMHPGVYGELAGFKPDMILFHGTCGWELLTVARYVRDNPGVSLYVDSHEDWFNSARNFVSREFLHRRYYGPILRRALPQIRKILCVSLGSIDFVHDLYRVPKHMLEFYPLAGHPLPDVDYAARREVVRARLGLEPDQIMLVQSGKQTRRKRLTECLATFRRDPNPKLRLYIAGLLHETIKSEAEAMIAADPRVVFLGWQSAEELTDLLCAADIYLQPGTESATMQHSLCCHCAIILHDYPAHRVYWRENGWLVRDDEMLAKAFAEAGSADLAAMQANSVRIAREMLDYAVLAERVLR